MKRATAASLNSSSRPSKTLTPRWWGPCGRAWIKLGDYRLLVLCDHLTPLALRTHTDEPVPFILYDSRTPGDRPRPYTEAAAKATGLLLDQGADLLPRLLER